MALSLLYLGAAATAVLGLVSGLHISAVKLLLIVSVPFAALRYLHRSSRLARRFSWAPHVVLAAGLSLAMGAALRAQGLRAAEHYVARFFPLLEAARHSQGRYPDYLPSLPVHPPWFIRLARWREGSSDHSLYYRTGCDGRCFCVGFPEANGAMYYWVYRSQWSDWGTDHSLDSCGH